MNWRIFILAFLIIQANSIDTFAGPPVPFLDDDEPGLNIRFTGDPQTTESGCAQDGVRAGMGDSSGKNHNELLECDNWDFSPDQWGSLGFLSGAFTLVNSPFSDDGAWGCLGNVFDSGNRFQGSACGGAGVRAVTTMKKQPPASLMRGHAMDPDKDWVLRFDFKVEILVGDTYGSDKLFEIAAPDTGDIFQVFGAGDGNSSILNGAPHRYRVSHGPWLDRSESQPFGTIIDRPLEEGTMTVHYKSSSQTLDMWHDDELVLPDFQSLSGSYDVDFLQLGVGAISFENALFDNILLGVLAGDSPIPGDANGDGVIDVADLGIVGAHFNLSEVTFHQGDFNGDGTVDVADLGILGANWAAAQNLSVTSAQSGNDPTVLIPEPAGLLVLAVGPILLRRRRN